MVSAGGVAELKVWAAVALLHMGGKEEATTLFGTAFLDDPALVELLPRVAALGLVPTDPLCWSG